MLDALLIRPARQDDIPALVALYEADEFGHGDSRDPAFLPAYRAAFAAIQDSSAEDLYVAELDGTIVGTFQTLMTTTLTGRGTLAMIIEAVQTRADCRGRGIGARMMAFCIDEARRRGVKTVQLTSNASRTDAHRFYERLGFVKSHAGFKMKLA
ncbi:GNAT family N-acetyltransferase [Rhizobiaceae bacterium BDR2-2]|uniref:GNAT family N-acetyltransferase n=1 Tax=Ectorhizobium quercum TaxID=2965071 RepID=A0AAE3N373_9HYPH|nr:GNAT family N-acetyltransferase [Ectorhizobium quercum]MCX8998879.1 GNAT family N-acetyltransferase [Ectorhizobium quercum]